MSDRVRSAEQKEIDDLALVQRLPGAIAHMQNPSKEVQVAAIKSHQRRGHGAADFIMCIRNLSYEAMIAAMDSTDFETMQANLGEFFLTAAPLSTQLKAVKTFVFAFDAIEHPCWEVKAQAIKSYPRTILYFDDADAELEYLALTHDADESGLNMYMLFGDKEGIWDEYDFSTEALDRVKPGLGQQYWWLKELNVDWNIAETQLISFMSSTEIHEQAALPVNLEIDRANIF